MHNKSSISHNLDIKPTSFTLELCRPEISDLSDLQWAEKPTHFASVISRQSEVEALLSLTSTIGLSTRSRGLTHRKESAGQEGILETAMSIWDLENNVQTVGCYLIALAEDPQQHVPLPAEAVVF